ncbi:hypothetical protein [Lacrimispora celerecrescens]|uniref:hypothetical protein n=1 Tax=Lacrimispora celerecrescens TaxID=29354 RepID=UPI00068D0815|nr:hypothetical protein [Lacrimispora celerecrescens]
MNDIKINYINHKEVSNNLETRICNKCGRELPIGSFRLMDNKVNAPYYLGQCKACEYKYQREYIEANKEIKFSDDLDILINRQYKEIKQERVLNLSVTGIIPIGTDENFVRLMDYRDYWISNYGRMIHYAYKRFSLLNGSYDSNEILGYRVSKNILCNGRWIYKQKTVYAHRLVVDEFIVNPDKQNNVYIWHGGYNKDDNYYRNLYPLNKEQYKIVKQNYIKTGDDSEEFILKVMNDIRYKPDNWSKPSMEPSVCGIGYCGDDEVDCTSQSYLRWVDMINRCYNEKFHERQVQYSDCEICDEWKNYSNFKKWYEENHYRIGNEQMDLDKDILIKGNKVYSPDTCCIVPHGINTLFITGKKQRGDLPMGVCFEKDKGKYRAYMNYQGKSIKLGTFDDPATAFVVYKEYKENIISDLAEKYKGMIPDKVYRAMLEWNIEVND